MTASCTVMLMDVRPGERLSIGGAATLEVVRKSGQGTRLRVVAPADVRVRKLESDPAENPLEHETRRLHSPYPA